MNLIAQAVPGMESWWDIMQKVGSGAAFIMGIGLVYIWRAYQAELRYSKERDKQMLTVMLELTTLIQGIDKRDAESATRDEKRTETILIAINDLKRIIETHWEMQIIGRTKAKVTT